MMTIFITHYFKLKYVEENPAEEDLRIIRDVIRTNLESFYLEA